MVSFHFSLLINFLSIEKIIIMFCFLLLLFSEWVTKKTIIMLCLLRHRLNHPFVELLQFVLLTHLLLLTFLVSVFYLSILLRTQLNLESFILMNTRTFRSFLHILAPWNNFLWSFLIAFWLAIWAWAWWRWWIPLFPFGSTPNNASLRMRPFRFSTGFVEVIFSSSNLVSLFSLCSSWPIFCDLTKRFWVESQNDLCSVFLVVWNLAKVQSESCEFSEAEFFDDEFFHILDFSFELMVDMSSDIVFIPSSEIALY